MKKSTSFSLSPFSPSSPSSMLAVSTPPPSWSRKSSHLRRTTSLDSIAEIPEHDHAADASASASLDAGKGHETKMAIQDRRKSSPPPSSRSPGASSWRLSAGSLLSPRSAREQRVRQNQPGDRNCGICFEITIMPRRTTCCGKLFCLEHITEWLEGASSNGRCPSCESPCSLEQDTIDLSPPVLIKRTFSTSSLLTLRSKRSGSVKASPTPSRHHTPPSNASPTISPTTDPIPSPSPLRSLLSSPVSPSSFFIPDDYIYDEEEEEISARKLGEHLEKLGLGPAFVFEDSFGVLGRLTSIVGLTLFLYVLLT